MFSYYFKREIKDRYIGNITGIAWIFIQPLIILLIYWFVFDKIFHQRFKSNQLEVSFIVYLAIGFWPWMAFSESVIRSITSVTDKFDLLGKVKLDLKTPVVAAITATFTLNLVGYLIVLLNLALFNDNFNYMALPLVLLPILQMYFLAVAIGLLLSALQVYIRDTLQVVTTLMTLWFFMTPIIYPESALPEKYISVIQLNPLYTPISFIHKAVLTKSELPWLNMVVLSVFIGVLLFISIKVFDRLSNTFEDFK